MTNSIGAMRNFMLLARLFSNVERGREWVYSLHLLILPIVHRKDIPVEGISQKTLTVQ